MILAPKGKSLAEEQQFFNVNKGALDKLKFEEILKHTPNIKGDWFLTQSPRCSNCGREITEIKGLNVGFLKFTCPYRGHQNN